MSFVKKIEDFANHLLIGIAQFLSPPELLNFSCCNKKLSVLLQNDKIWKDQVENNLLSSAILEFNTSTTYRAAAAISCNYYGIIKRNLMALLEKVGVEKEIIITLFKDSARKKKIDEMFQKNGIKLPLEVYLLYRLLNGQQEVLEDEIYLFGGLSYYGRYFAFYFSPFDNPIEKISKKFGFIPLSKGQKEVNPVVYIDIRNQLGKGAGTIFSFITHIQKQSGVVLKTIILKNSITSYLSELQHCSVIEDFPGISWFDTANNPQSDVTTKGIRVRGRSIFVPWDTSYNDINLFVYQIRISDNGVQGKWKLTTRHWVISNNGVIENVKGPGVIGLYPEISPGCDDFWYESCCPISNFNGYMEGEVNFQNMETKEEIQVKVGRMNFEFPKGSCLGEFDPDNGVFTITLDRMNDITMM